MRYAYAQNINNEPGLVDISPQPRTPGIIYPETIWATSGKAYDEGRPFTAFEFSFSLYEEYANHLSIFGLTSVRSFPCTVYLRKNDDSWGYFNAIIVRPNVGDGLERATGWWQRVRFDVVHLVEI